MNELDEIISEFPHKPGGMIDKHLQHEMQREAARAEHGTVTEYGREAVKAVRTVVDAGDLVIPSMLYLNGTTKLFDRLLPLDPHRRSALIMAIDNDIYLTRDETTAVNLAGSNGGYNGGFYLPVKIPIPIQSQGQLFAVVTTTATPSRVSVLIYKSSA